VGRLEFEGRRPVELIDSQQYEFDGLDSDGFDEDARLEHGLKRRAGRAEKGRVFYITAGGVVAGFIIFHVPPSPGPLIVENIAIDSRMPPRASAKIRRSLLFAALEASEAAGRTTDRLAWATDNDSKAEAIQRELGFGRVTRPKNSDCSLKHYLEREFPSGS
jgi:hypothetical protein